MIKPIIDYGTDKPHWFARVLFVYFGNPIVIFMYSVAVFPILLSQQYYNAQMILSVLLYPITLPAYIGWIALNAMVIQKYCTSSHTFDQDDFLASYGTNGAILASIPWSLTMFVFITAGTDGISFAFFFVPPFFIAAPFYCVMWIVAIKQSLKSTVPIDKDDAFQHIDI